MKYILSSRKEQCKRCLYRMDHPLGLHIDSEGICSGCRVHEEKNEIDWTQRWEDLRRLVEPYRKKTGSHYDCIVPVSGANDSYFIVHVVKNLLGLNPLLVTHNKYFNTNIGIENLANLRTVFDCDLVMQNIDPKKVKNITRTTIWKHVLDLHRWSNSISSSNSCKISNSVNNLGRASRIRAGWDVLTFGRCRNDSEIPIGP